ncbi:MAG: hypothetical protein R2751_19885 [Bacteroidales bacterium]
MKTRKTLVVLLLAIAPAISAQFNTGASYFSGSTRGSLGFSSLAQELNGEVYRTNALYFGLTPEAGYFIKNRLALGAAIGLNYTAYFEGVTDDYSIVAGPSVRYYLPRDTELQIFLYGFFGFGGVPDHKLVEFSAGPGFNYFLTERVALEARTLYTLTREWNPVGGGHHNLHDVGATIGVSLFFSDLTFITRQRELVD